MPQKNFFQILFVVLFACVGALAQTSQVYLTEPAISPDRKEIAFVSGGDIWTVPATGGTASLLVSNAATESRPQYSPDGKSLAFVSTRTGNGDIYVLDFASGDTRRITFDDALDNLDGWSRDGEWLYFSSSSKDISGMSDIFRVRASGGTPMIVSGDRYTSEFYAAASPDKSTIAFAARGLSNSQWWRKGHSHIDETEIWLKKGDDYQQIMPRGAKQLWPMWNADGTRIYFVSDRSGAQNLWTMPLNGQPKQLTNFTDGRVLWPNISIDGKQIVFERDFQIYTLNTDDGKANLVNIALRGAAAGNSVERANLAGRIQEMALSPDGKKVALVARGEIFAASAKENGEAVRVTKTSAPESYVAWSPDSRRIVYSSERDGAMNLFQYDFASETETRLTSGNNQDYAAVFSPDGKSAAFYRNGRALMVYDFANQRTRQICQLYTDAPPLIGTNSLAWSPDNKWLAFLGNEPKNRSYTNVYVAAANQNQPTEARAVSFLANSNAGSLSWSADGTFILFDTNQRTEEGSLARVDLILKTPKFREDTFRDLFKQENPKEKPQSPTTPPSTLPTPNVSPTPQTSPTPQNTPNSKPTSPSDLVTTPNDDKNKQTQIVFDNIRQRLSLLGTGVNVVGQTISPDGKTVVLLAVVQGQFNLYAFPLDDLADDASARQLTSTASPKSDAHFSPDGKEVYYLENGRVQIVDVAKAQSRSLAVNMEMNAVFADEKMQVFEQGWRYLRDNFYDDKFHGVDWNAVHARYEPLVKSAKTNDEVRRLMALMVGELNASHLGVTPPANPALRPSPIGKLGLRFDRQEFEQNGRLKITEIIALSPAAVTQNISVGDYLLSVDGANIGKQTNLDELLENKTGKRVELNISASPDGANKHLVALKPVTTGAEKNLLYRQWVENNRAYVERISNGRFGYVHLPDMSADSLARLYVDLDAQNQAKQAVVIDIRNNNGGFVNPYVIDVFARRGYLQMTERNRWTVPGRGNLGQRALERPTILITNQHTLSDGEDLTEGYRALKLGKVVGEPTAGWIIFTWTINLFDGTTFRLPRQGITGADGKDMELNPRPVDIPVTRPIGETLTGKDSQLDAAVRELELQTKK